MWRIERRLLIPAVAVLLIAGLLVPAGAAPPKGLKPVWTLTQQYDGTAKLVTLKGTVPADTKNYLWFDVYIVLGQCDGTGCRTPFTFCTVGYPCSLDLSVGLGDPTNTATGTGWTATSEIGKTGLTVTIVLSDGFFIRNTEVIDVDVKGKSSQGDPDITASTWTEQAFQ